MATVAWQSSVENDAITLIRNLHPEVAVMTGAGASRSLRLPVMNDFFDSILPGDWRQTLSGRLHAVNGDYRYWLLRMAYPDPTTKVFDLERVMAVIEALQEQFLSVPELARQGIIHLLNARVGGQALDYATWWQQHDTFAKSSDGIAISLGTACDAIVRRFNDVFGDVSHQDADALWFPFLSAVTRFCGKPIPIFTTNYDVAFERLSRPGTKFRELLHLIDGFAADPAVEDTPTWHPKNYAPETENGSFYLFKLHGSADWCLKESPPLIMRQMGGACSFPTPQQGHQCIRRPLLSKGRPDPETEPWFHAIYQAFQETLHSVNRLIVVGFSFRDDALREMVSQELTRRKDFQVVAVSPASDTPDDESVLHLAQMAKKHGNFRWLQKCFAVDTSQQIAFEAAAEADNKSKSA